MAERLVCDCETDGLLPDMTKLHMVQCGTLEGDDVTIYCDTIPDDLEMCLIASPIRPLHEGITRMARAKSLYFHNGVSFDMPAINRFFPGTVTRDRLVDTLVLCRLGQPHERNHSLDSWGRRLGVLKGTFNGPWHTVTPDMLLYAEQDIVVGRALTRKALEWTAGQDRAVATEHAFAYWMWHQEQTGFTLDVEAADRLYCGLLAEKRELEHKLRDVFPARWAKVGEKTPLASNSRYGYVRGVPYTVIDWDEFSPSSRQAIGRRLQERGWKPSKFTAGGQAVVDEDTLVAISARFPEAALLARYFEVEKQASAVGGDKGWLRVVGKDGRVHGRVNTLGAYTQRCSHSNPNMAQVPKNGGFRRLWLPRTGWKLVGVDGEGIQARVLSHYLAKWDGGVFARRIESGRKEDKSDVHSANAMAIDKLFDPRMEFKHRRDTVKNCLYAIMFGAQDPRLGQTIKDGHINYAHLKPPRVPNRELGAAVRRGLEKTMKGLSALTELVEETFAKRKHLLGLDGRKLFPPSKRNALVTIIQAGEATIMKTALVIFGDEAAPAKGWLYGRDFAFVANVHDEAQMEARPEVAAEVGAAFAQCITEAGVRLGMKVALAGEAKVGNNWAETH